jgi:acetolactate synthase-1/3 small subunit
MEEKEMKHIISALVENKFGVLARVSGLFSARGFNIDSLAVGETADPEVSRMTIVVEGDERTLEQVKKQLNRLIDVISVNDFTNKEYIDRELVLIKVRFNSQSRSDIIEVVEMLGGKIVHVGVKTMCIEIAGDKDKIVTTLKLLKPYGVKELVRTGRIAIAKE